MLLYVGTDIRTDTYLETVVTSQPPESSGKDQSSIAEEETIKDSDKRQFEVAPSMGLPRMADVGGNLTSLVEKNGKVLLPLDIAETYVSVTMILLVNLNMSL